MLPVLLGFPLCSCPRPPALLTPSPVSNFARKSGDFSALSKTDLKLIALTAQLENEVQGKWKLSGLPEEAQPVPVVPVPVPGASADAPSAPVVVAAKGKVDMNRKATSSCKPLPVRVCLCAVCACICAASRCVGSRCVGWVSVFLVWRYRETCITVRSALVQGGGTLHQLLITPSLRGTTTCTHSHLSSLLIAVSTCL